MPIGEKSGTAKLTAAQVAEIRGLIKSEVNREIAERFGVSRSTISAIANRQNWNH